MGGRFSREGGGCCKGGAGSTRCLQGVLGWPMIMPSRLLPRGPAPPGPFPPGFTWTQGSDAYIAHDGLSQLNSPFLSDPKDSEKGAGGASLRSVPTPCHPLPPGISLSHGLSQASQDGSRTGLWDCSRGGRHGRRPPTPGGCRQQHRGCPRLSSSAEDHCCGCETVQE